MSLPFAFSSFPPPPPYYFQSDFSLWRKCENSEQVRMKDILGDIALNFLTAKLLQSCYVITPFSRESPENIVTPKAREKWYEEREKSIITFSRWKKAFSLGVFMRFIHLLLHFVCYTHVLCSPEEKRNIIFAKIYWSRGKKG